MVTAGQKQDKPNRKLPLQGETDDQESGPGWSRNVSRVREGFRHQTPGRLHDMTDIRYNTDHLEIPKSIWSCCI